MKSAQEDKKSWKHSAKKSEKIKQDRCFCGGYLWNLKGVLVCGDCGRTYLKALFN